MVISSFTGMASANCTRYMYMSIVSGMASMFISYLNYISC